MLKLIDTKQLMCPERDMFGHSRLANVPDQAYELFQVLELDLSSIVQLFENENLNLAASYIRQYFLMRGTHNFFHCMVRGVALPRFLEIVQGSPLRMLPFSCFSESGPYEDARHRQSRHFLIAYPTDRFVEEIWSRIKIPKSDKPEKGYKYRLLIPMTHPMLLVDAMGYLSQRECSDLEDEWNDEKFHTRKVLRFYDFNETELTALDKNGHNLNHFNIFNSLPTGFRKALCMQWDGGLMQLIGRHYQSTDPEYLVCDSLRRVNGLWKIAVKDLPNIELNEVLGVAKHWKPKIVGSNGTSNGTGEEFVYLANDRLLFFEKDESLVDLDESEWLKIQAQNGNLVYGAIQEDFWTMNRYLQKCFDEIEVCMSKFKEEIAERERLLEQYEAEKQSLIRKPFGPFGKRQ